MFIIYALINVLQVEDMKLIFSYELIPVKLHSFEINLLQYQDLVILNPKCVA